MRISKYSVFITIYKVMEKHNKYWTYASQTGIRKILHQIHGVDIERRMLCYHLADLRADRLIKTQKRNHYKDGGNLVLLSSAHCITLRGYLYLARMGVAGVWERIKELRRRYTPPLAQRPGGLRHETIQEEPPLRPGENPFLDPLWRKRHGFIERFEDLEKNGSTD